MIKLFKSIYTNQLGTMNLLPAVLTSLSGLLSTPVSETQYELYKKQAQEYINNARENAKLIRQKGEIDLRNLRYKNKLERGEDIATLGATGGNMTGTNFDVVIQKEKVRKMNEAVVDGDSITKSMLAMVNGYSRAAGIYGMTYSKAKADKTNAWGHIMKGLVQYVQSTAGDSKLVDRMKTEDIILNRTYEKRYTDDLIYYGELDEPPTMMPEDNGEHISLFHNDGSKIEFY